MPRARSLLLLVLLAGAGYVAASNLVATGAPKRDDPVGKLSPVSITVGTRPPTLPPAPTDTDGDTEGDDDDD